MYEIIAGRKDEERKTLGLKGSILLGKQYVQMGRTTSLSNEVYLDVNNSHVVFIAGKRGSGKSSTMGTIAEGIMDLEPEIRQNISMILLDTMGVYWTMKYPNKKDEEILKKWKLVPKGLNVQIFTPTGSYEKYKKEGVPTDFPFSIIPSELDIDDWCITLGIDRISEVGVLIEKTINFLQRNKDTYSLQDIIDTISDDIKTENRVKDAAINRFENAKLWGLFDIKGTKISDIAVGGQITVLDVSAYATQPNGWAIKSLLVGLVAKKLFIERMKIRKEEEFEEIKSKTEYFREGDVSEKNKEPLVWLLLDEAHEFLVKEGKTAASDALITILREGRQPGISLVLATQQPDKIHSDVMTQSDIIISFRLTAQIDTVALESLAQSYMRGGIEDQLNTLPRMPGAGILIDDANERTFQFQVRPKITWHGGSAPSLIKEKKEEV